MNKSLYIHIGMAKAASSTLQECLFSCLPDFHYISSGHQGIKTDQEARAIIHTIVGCERCEYLERYDQLCQLVYRNVYGGNKDQVLISDESFATGYSRFPGQVEKVEIAHRLGTLFPSSKILLVIRNQVDILKSLYVQQLKSSECISNWQEWLNKQKRYSHLTSQLNWLKYDVIYDTYSEIFGAENIYLILFEDILQKDLYFYKGIEAFLGNSIDAKTIKKMLSHKYKNKRMTKLSYLLNKNSNNQLFSKVTKLIPNKVKKYIKRIASSCGQSIEPKIAEQDINFIRDFYSKSNYRMSALVGFNLHQKGYPMLT